MKHQAGQSQTLEHGDELRFETQRGLDKKSSNYQDMGFVVEDNLLEQV